MHRYRTTWPELAGAAPWAMLEDRIPGFLAFAESIADRSGPPVPSALPSPFHGEGSGVGLAAGVAVIPISGMIVPRAGLLTAMMGWTGLDALRAQLRALAADPAVSAIVLNIDSPGGLASGLVETGALLRDVRDQKLVVAYAETMAASAAYWLAASATRFIVGAEALTASVGTVLVHGEISKALEAEGETVTVFRNPGRKAEGNMLEPITPAAAANFQAIVDEMTALFQADVAKGRGVSLAKVRADFGQGSVMTARQAVAAGVADSIGTLDSALAAALGRKRSAARAEADPPALAAEIPAPPGRVDMRIEDLLHPGYITDEMLPAARAPSPQGAEGAGVSAMQEGRARRFRLLQQGA